MKLRLFLIITLVGITQVKSQSQWPLQLEPTQSYTQFLRPIQVDESAIQADLPDNVVPKAYRLKLRPILDPNDPTGNQWTAPGSVEIDIQPIQSTSQIILHRYRTLTIDEATVKVTGQNGAISVANQTYADADNFQIISLASNLVGGQTYTLSMDFVASVSASTSGLYRAEYTDDEGTEYRLATTQFESNSARQAFPCFDEPRWKTNFTISLGYKNSTYNTLCNSNKRVTAEPDPTLANWVWDHFETTVRAPTYLIAIVISNFDFAEASEPVFGDRPVRIYGEPRHIAPGGDKTKGSGNYAANASAHLLNFLEKKYVYPYEMPKMDSVAIPDPFFGAGAMENWGLNIYREQYLLMYPELQTQATREQITSVLAHELAHQWFGNLVTCKTWSNLWLNEGFATYVANFGVEDTHPEYKELKGRLVGQVQNAMNNDVTGSRPIYGLGASSTITYDKGGSIIRMMEGFLGPDTLTKGIVNYLKALAYEAAVQDDLFAHLTEQAVLDGKLPSTKTIKTIMDTWTLQAGFPLIRVNKAGPNQVNISQTRFQPAGAAATTEMYEVPIATATAASAQFSNHTPAIWLSKSETSTLLTHNTSTWLVLNPDAMGYYRVLYDQNLTQLILDQLEVKRETLSALSRSALIDDYFTFYERGHISVSRALETTTLIENNEGTETDFVVWYALFNRLSKALSMFQAYSSGPNHSLRYYLLRKIERAIEEIGWVQSPEETGTIVLYRAKLLDWACALESERCFDLAREYMHFWTEFEVEMIYPDIQPVIYCAAVAAVGEAAFDFLLNKFVWAPVGTYYPQRAKLLNSVSCAKDVPLIERLLNMTINATSIIGKTVGDSYNILQRVAANPTARPILLKFLDENFDAVNAYFDGNLNYITNVLTVISRSFTKQSELELVQAFIQNHQVLQGSLDNALSTIRGNIEWISLNYDLYDYFFKAH